MTLTIKGMGMRFVIAFGLIALTWNPTRYNYVEWALARWDDLPPLVRLGERADPFAAYRTCSVLPGRFLPVEHAVRVILDQTDVDRDALRQVAERSAGEGVPVPGPVADRVSYVFCEET